MSKGPGLFVISLDTELAWGSFDTGGISQYEAAYRNTRAVIQDLCELFDAYDMPVTWALVMHLLEDCRDHSDSPQPEFDWVDWYTELPCSSGVNRELWYAPGIIEQIKSTTVDHEIGLHGHTHMMLGDSGCTPAAAQYEVRRAIELANEVGVDPETYIFPRNNIGHLDILRDAGLKFYRGPDEYWYEHASPTIVKKTFRFGDDALQRTPSVVLPRKRNGLIELPGSQILRPYRGPWKFTPEQSQLNRAKKGLEKAAESGKVFHLWFHPFNLALNKDRHITLLQRILEHASQLRSDGELEFCTLATAATRKCL